MMSRSVANLEAAKKSSTLDVVVAGCSSLVT